MMYAKKSLPFSLMLCVTFCCVANAAEPWAIVAGPSLAGDEAVQVALADLVAAGTEHGLAFTVVGEDPWPAGNVLVVGAPERNPQSARLVDSGVLQFMVPDDEQGYAIATVRHEGRRIIAVAGGSVIGEVYGLYWLWDRIRVTKGMPDINVVRVPALKVRVGAAWGRHGHGGSSKEQMRAALRHSTNWVAGPNALDLIPWDAEPERTRNTENREQARELIAYAHALHMRYFSFTNEFTYHPSLLEECGASLNPCDPKYWDALQGKFRKLFEALPELDGVELCNDDISGFWDNYRAYDVLHEHPECEWSYSKRFRTFVQKVHEVVVGDFHKIYFHFTWGLTPHEQHVQPAVFREIFTEAVPTEGLYLMPKITAADRWWYQPYNSTFNQTPHDTIVCFETMNYYEGGKSHLFPTFSGQYFQAGLQFLLLPEDHNLKGAASLAGMSLEGWDTRSAYAYALYRLMWEPNEDIEAIARDFCAIHFGTEAAEIMAQIYLLSPSAYKYGLHLEAASYGQFNSLLHMRVGTFPLEGYPTIDGGREHLEFLRRLYLRCKPWRNETLAGLEHGLAVAERMGVLFEQAKPLINDPVLARELEERIDMTRLLIATNIGYVSTAFAFFDYLDGPNDSGRATLAKAVEKLIQARAAFTSAAGFDYRLFGVDQMLRNAQAALEDAAAAHAALENAPSRAELEATIAAMQRRYVEVLETHAGRAVHFAHFEAQIDGRDILDITGSTYGIEHLRWDGPEVKECTFLAPLPAAPVTVIPKDLYSRPLHPFVIEQPTAENNYTVRIYLDDLPGGKDWVRCDLYYLPEEPEAFGLELPWRK